VHLGRRDGGAERQTAALLAGLARRGHRVLGLVRRGTPVERRALAAQAPVFPLGPRFPAGPGGVLTWWSRGRARLLAAAGGWDVIHFADPDSRALTAGILAGAVANGAAPAARVLTYRGAGGSPGRLPASLRRHLREGGTVVPVSEALWAALVREGVDEDHLAVVHPGIEIRAFAGGPEAREAARRSLGLGAAEEVAGAVAVLDRASGAADLLEAAAILARDRPRFRLVIAGDGPERRALEARARGAGLSGRVLFAGWREDVAAVVPAFDLYVHAGRGGEAFPLALVEALAAGVPAVARDQPGIREIIENGRQGLFVPGSDPASMARTVARALSDREAFREMGRAGAVRVQRFHTQAMVDATEALYYRLVKTGG
jgi:glycosyltransferase involved in cell wall biosynthesis